MEYIAGIVGIFIVVTLGLFISANIRKRKEGPKEIQIQIDDSHVLDLLSGKTVVWNHNGQAIFLLRWAETYEI